MILFLLLGVMMAGMLWRFCFKHWWSKDVSVKLWFESGTVYAGQETKLYEVIENRKRMPVPVLEVRFRTRKELDFTNTENTNVSDYIYKRDVFAILGRQKITREIPVKCIRRGKYTVSDAEITAHTLLYSKYYSKGITTPAELYVYAKMTDVSEIMSMCEQMLGTIQCVRHLYEDPFAFRTIRGYTTDDPMKTINWKASARTGALMVNTYDSAQSRKAMVFLDVEDTGILKREDLVEESIAMAATIVRKLLRQGTEVGFAYNGEGQVVMPSNSKGILTGLERMLAEYSCEKGTEAFGQLVGGLFSGVFAQKPLSQDTLLVFITKNLNAALMERIRECAGTYYALVVMPVCRGEKAVQSDDVRGSDRIRVVVREVERG